MYKHYDDISKGDIDIMQKKDNGMKKLLIIVIVLLSIIIVGGSMMFLVQIREKEEQSTGAVPTAVPTKTPEETIIEESKKLFSKGEYEQVISNLEPYTFNPEAEKLISYSHLNLGNELMNNEKYEEAIEHFRSSDESEAKEKLEICKKEVKKKSQIIVVQYAVNQSKNDEKGKYFSNGTGKLRFVSDTPLDGEWCDTGGKYITYTMPESMIHFVISNQTGKTLKNLKLILNFDGIALYESLDNTSNGFEYQNYINGLGGYAGAIGSFGTLQDGLQLSTTFSLQPSYSFDGSNGGNVTISVSADNFKTQSYKIPIVVK